jgi:hypothetical protein
MASMTLRPRTATELIDAAFQLLRLRYGQLVVITAVAMLPALLIEATGPANLIAVAPDRFFALIAIKQLLVIVASAGVVLVTSEAYLGRESALSDVFRRVGARIGFVLLALIVQWIAIMLGFVALFIGAFVAVAWTFAMQMAVMLEGSGPLEAFSRSRQLARGSGPRILGILILTGLIVGVIGGLLGGLVGGVLGLVTHNDQRAVMVASDVMQILIIPLQPVVLTLLYYDLRIRKEGFDLEVLASELGLPAVDAPLVPGPPAGASPIPLDPDDARRRSMRIR